MTKYLTLAKIQKAEKVGFCYYDSNQNQPCELFAASGDQIETKINLYQPDCLLFSSSQGLRRKHRIAKIESNFPYLKIVHVSGISYLEDLIIAQTISIPGLKITPGGPWGSHIYPTYYYYEKKIDKAERKALFTLYLHLNEPWQELITQNKAKEKISNNFDYQPKNINMPDLSPQVQELTENLTQMSKLSHLGNLNSQEILFLIEKSRKFVKTLESYYILKKSEEEEELKLKKENES